MNRQIALDTETTGLDPSKGHRIIEIGCVELIDRQITGQHWHYYLNPDREIDPGAMAVHGISTAFLKDKPRFNDVADSFLDFIRDSQLVIHNAPFDLSFLDQEMNLLKRGVRKISTTYDVVDTLILGRKKHPGQKNNLDALCKRYSIDISARELHGALLDAQLLAMLYLAMTGGQGSFFDNIGVVTTSASKANDGIKKTDHRIDTALLTIIKAQADELQEHKTSLNKLKDPLWETLTWLEEY